MPKITGSLSTIDVNVLKIKDALHKELVRVLREAVKIWVLTAQANIPVWSGASQSTLKTLAGKVGVDIAVFPVPGAPNRTGIGAGAGFGDLEINRERGTYTFFYLTNLPYLIRNETQNMDAAMRHRLRTPTPYEFRKKADAAFRDYIRQHLERLPLGSILRRNITVQTIRTR